MPHSSRTWLLLLPLLLFFAACDSADETPQESNTIVLNVTDLPALQNGVHYEGWAVLGNGTLVSTGKFNVNSGALVDLSGTAIEGNRFTTTFDLAEASRIVITIEPSSDANSVPSATKVLAGNLSGGEASLSIGHPDAMNEDFSASSGSFVLATPTNADDSDETSGVWFASLASGAPVASLVLPDAPAGWAYEGWVVVDGTPLSTGVFNSPNMADDAVTFYAGGGPPLPGEDFLVNAPAGLTFPVDLSDSFVAITLEPAQDDSAAPFAIIPLSATIVNPAQDRVDYALANVASDIVRGTARVE